MGGVYVRELYGGVAAGAVLQANRIYWVLAGSERHSNRSLFGTITSLVE